MNLKMVILIGLLVAGFALVANAGSVADGDSDLVPDSVDNCPFVANGSTDPNGNNQLDIDGNGKGLACDGDLDGDGTVGVGDFAGTEPLPPLPIEEEEFADLYIEIYPHPSCPNGPDPCGSTGVGFFNALVADLEFPGVGVQLECKADMDCDGRVTVGDFALWYRCLNTEGCEVIPF